jgi:hypothetical protein
MLKNRFSLLALALYLSFALISCGSNDDELPFDEEFKGKVATYTISGNNITLTKDWGSSSTFYANPTNQMQLWNFYANLIPSDLRPEFIKLELFADKDDDTGAYVSPINPNDLSKWELGYNMAYAWSNTFEFNKSDVAFNSIHEYAHVLTLNNTQLVAGGSEDTCANYFPGEGCSREAAYINQFFTNYWTDIFDESQAFEEDDDEAFFAFYDKYADRFVSEYASTNPGEDIAESFARFVLLNQPTGNQIKDQKVRFFYDFQELIVVRDRIRANVDFQFDINQVGEARLEKFLFRRNELNRTRKH